MCSDHSRIKLKINKKNMTGKYPSVWKLSHILLYNPRHKEEITMKKNWLKIIIL